ncbi:hypothetical protein HPB47_023770 [Ixodes persulcatus]|uniref:Uncharacterized protein n=1 Tax=Ixodes persulcatus TaxID=34615 RepID=A0AC60Q6M1_IXOPE|nr:hypothetical protein HPB47_023770 [Ixodes persulcatus]
MDRKDIDALIIENARLKQELNKAQDDLKLAQSEIRSLKATNTRAEYWSQRTSEEVLKSDRSLKFHTGIVSVALFNTLLRFILSVWTPALQMRPADQLIMVLMKLRRGLLNEDLACRFGISPATVSRVFHAWLDVLNANFAKMLLWQTWT